LTDFTRVKVRVIPDRFPEADPRAVLDKLSMLERLPGQDA
jgi:hypothetical protein